MCYNKIFVFLFGWPTNREDALSWILTGSTIDGEAHILQYLEANGEKHLYTYRIYHFLQPQIIILEDVATLPAEKYNLDNSAPYW